MLTNYAHTGKLPQHKLEEYEAVASDFVAAYETGDTEALRRIIEHFQIQRLPSLEEFRKGVRERLVARQKAEPSKEELTLSDAQFLVAGMHGCESWEQITQHGNG